MIYDDTTPIAALTVGDIKDLFRGMTQTETPSRTVPSGNLVYGLRGIQRLFGVSHKTAQYYKDHVIQDAVRQNGRTIVVDADLALELSTKQFQMRYSDIATGLIHIFPSNFIRAEIDPELIAGADLEQEILDSIEEAAAQGISFFIIDNITFICNDSEKGDTAGSFMMELIRLKKKFNLTTIVIAHTPKRRLWEPITQNDLAGSTKLINFFDAGIALARSAKDTNLRYLKQVKVRTGEYQYDAENVIILDISKTDGFLKFEVQGYAREDDHLRNRESSDNVEEILSILRLRKDGKSLREIARTLEMSLGMVQRRLRTAEEQNITLQEDSDSSVSDCIGVSDAIQPIHPIHPDTARLPFKEED